MTILADIGRLDVTRVLALGCRSVVATTAVATHAGMIKVRRQPGGGRMTIIAGIARGDMARIFALRRRAVVAARATTENSGVVNFEDR